MRIFTAVRHSADPRFFYGGLWSANFHPALEALGHEVVASQIDLLPASRFMHIAAEFTREELALRADLTERIIDEVRMAHADRSVDLFLSYFYNAHFDPAGFDEIHRLGIPTVNFYCNSMYQFPLVAAVAAKAAFSWHAERDAASRYRAAGGRPVWIQMAADPDVCRPIRGTPRRAKACFVGQRYADRDRLFRYVVRSGIPLEIYGSGWSVQTNGNGHDPGETATYLGRTRPKPATFASYLAAFRETVANEGPVRGLNRVCRQLQYRQQTRSCVRDLQRVFFGRASDIAATYAGFEVVLNASNVWADGRPGSALIPHVRLRDFEAPMCRTCYLTGHTDEIAEFYDVGTEIETYRTPEELVSKARFYLDHPDRAERMREAGFQRARRDHTWQRRFERLLQAVGVSR
jgi:spore maturation protein CgeB